ncbi:MAG: hypothetical protein KC646_03690 [Candidatus Cloacimonetes bacterium]|nr:hypothetical protein [Candidatus Cloacimonadota bacterium]
MVNEKDTCEYIEETNVFADNETTSDSHHKHVNDCDECQKWINFTQRLNHSICENDPSPQHAVVWHQIAKSIPEKKVSWFEQYLPKFDMELVMICSMAMFFIVALGSVQHSIKEMVPNQNSSIIHMEI